MTADEVVLVFTYQNKDVIECFNGTQSWVLDQKRASKCKYVILVKNRKHLLCSPDWHNRSDAEDEKEINHGTGFLVGKISNITKPIAILDTGMRERNKHFLKTRSLIEFSEYAEIKIENLWDGQKNPIWYNKQELIDLDFKSLEFKKYTERNYGQCMNYMHTLACYDNIDDAEHLHETRGLSINEAKQALSMKYDIAVDKIDIILRG